MIVLVVWASAFVAIRTATHSFSPGALAWLRLAVGALVLSPFAFRARQPLPRGRELALVAIYGLAWFGAYNVALNTAEQHLDPGTSALLVNVAPLLIALGAGALLGEGFPRRLLVGLAIGLAGVIVISVGSGQHHGDAFGVAMALLAAIVYSVGVLSQKVALRTVRAVQATWLGCVIATVATLPFAPQAVHQLTQARTGDILLVVYLGAFSTGIGFLLWAFALGRTTAGSLGSTTLAVPAITVLMSWLLLDELPTAAAGIGGAICLIGVSISAGLIRYSGRRRGRAARRD